MKGVLFKVVECDLKVNSKGILYVFRNLVKDCGVKFNFCVFKFDYDLNLDVLDRYNKNILCVVFELIYFFNGYDGCIDLILFVNGLLVVILEFKFEFK